MAMSGKVEEWKKQLEESPSNDELEILREENMRLSSKLAQTEAELQTLRLSQARMEATNSAKLAAQSAALVERLSSVQREREQVLATQLRAALREKEETVSRLREMEERDVSGSDQLDKDPPSDKGLQDLVEQLRGSKSAHELRQGGVALLERARALRELNRKSLQEKMKLLQQEREAALSKQHGLESEISRLERQLEMMKTEYKLVDKTRVRALQAQLQAAIAEREEWREKAEKYEDVCDTLRIVSSLRQSLSKEDDIRRRYEAELQRSHAEKAAVTDQLEHALRERNIAVEERNHIIQERNVLALKAQQEYERAERFQRLALVLRKKAMAASTVPYSPSHIQPSTTS